MRPRRPHLATLAAVAALAAAGPSCGGGDARPLRVGGGVDCMGVNRSLQDPELAAAELPLIARGAKLLGAGPSSGMSPARVAGRDVEVVRGCTELLEFSALTEEVRRLIEVEHVDAVIAGTTGP